MTLVSMPKMSLGLAEPQRRLANRIWSRQAQQQDIRMRWNWLPWHRRSDLYYRYQGRLDRLFDALGLTGMCTYC